MWIRNVKNKIINIYTRDDIEMKYKLLMILIVAVLCGSLVGTAIDIVNGMLNMAMNICLIIVCVLSLILCHVFHKYELAADIVIVTIGLIILPLMYFSDGGMHSGMTIWLLMAIIVAFLMTAGAARYILCGALMAMDITLMLVEFHHPELVTTLDTERKFTIDIITSFVSVGIILCMLILIQIKSYDRQRVMLEEQRKELLQKQEELEEAVRTAQSADQAKTDFLANMSHEIRTPINAVLGLDEMIVRETTEPEILDYATNIQSSGRTLLSIINDILDFSKIEAGRMELFPEDYQLSSIINDVSNIVSQRIADKGLELRIENDPNLPYMLYGDAVRIRQIILNLMTNAAKYTNKGTITLKIRYDDIDSDNIMLKVDVMDTGIGIKEENIQYLFQTFRRIDLKNNRKIEGTGLGLALTKNIVEMLGGTIGVQSVYGSGSTFYFEVPQKVVSREPMGRVTHQPTTKIKSYHASFRAPNANILAVDDMAINLKVFHGLLKDTRMHIDQATSGATCLELVQQKHYDMIFMDHMMPEMDGIETFEKMKELGDYINADTPVIVLTANAIEGVKEMYLDEGFTDYISKPIKYETLEAMIREYLPAELME